MNVQLLLLLALVGPFCAFTHASPTGLPTTVHSAISSAADVVTEAGEPEVTDTTEASKPDPDVETSAPELSTAAAEVAATEAAVAPMELSTAVVSTEGPVEVTEAPAIAVSTVVVPLETNPPAAETAAPTEAEPEVGTEATAAEEAEGAVVIEDHPEEPEATTSGQIVGIVIGALLAVVIVIAVVIAVVRRMGKYSSAKNKKPAKKDSVMVSPLRKKAAKQQERRKFWKF